jgi:hypothetical protein
MTRYDLSEFRTLTWVRITRWFRAGCATFGITFIGWTAYGVYLQAIGTGIDELHLVGLVLVFFILSFFVVIGVGGRPPANELVLDEAGIQLNYRRGRPDVRSWDDPSTSVRGRRTDGVQDSVSGGRALWSIYGRLGAMSETFIPKAAFEEIVRQANSHGLALRESISRPGWFFYRIKRGT